MKRLGCCSCAPANILSDQSVTLLSTTMMRETYDVVFCAFRMSTAGFRTEASLRKASEAAWRRTWKKRMPDIVDLEEYVVSGFFPSVKILTVSKR